MAILLLNPGQMGAALGAALATRHDTLWVAQGRGASSRARAETGGLREVATLARGLQQADIVFSVVPPASAQDTAAAVARHGYQGVYVDANAVSPATGQAVARTVQAVGARAVDGGIIGPPPQQRGDTRLYLSGPGAAGVAALLEGALFEAIVLNEEAGSTAASALKMAYAGWTKASSALLLNVRALARAAGVEQALLDEWAISMPDLPQRSERSATANAHKAWRFVGEMHEIADTMASQEGLPEEFHRAAAALWERLAAFKDDMEAEPAAVFEQLAGGGDAGSS
ncbi:MAG: DUF1932 domain-containing protein [Gammaproteobacteria bacterium]|nr:DUF1932 domain-containing protein [Gammaproteobacteria bacterium]